MNYNDESLQELVSLSREQLNIMQQLNVKSNPGGISRIGSGQGIAEYSDIPRDETEGLFSRLSKQASEMGKDLKEKMSRAQQVSPEATSYRSMDKSSSGASTIMSVVGNLGANALGAASKSLLGMTVIPAAIGAYVGYGVNQFGNVNDIAKYSQRFSTNYIDFTESNNNRGSSGFSVRESYEVGRGIYNLAPKMRMSVDTMKDLTMQYSESGLLRNASDTSSVISKIEELTTQAKQMGILLNEMNENGKVVAQMAQLYKMGVGTSNSTTIAARTNLASGFLGVNASTLMDATVQNTANIVSGTGISATSVAGDISSANLVGGMMYSQLDKSGTMTYAQRQAYNYMNNIGKENVGTEITQLTQGILSSSFTAPFLASIYKYDASSGQMVIDPSAFSQVSSMSSLTQMGQLGSSNLQAAGVTNPSAVTEFMSTAGTRAMNDLGTVDRISLIKSLVQKIKNQSGGRLSDIQILQSYFGFSSEQAALMSTYLSIDTNTLVSAQAVTNTQESMSETRAALYGGLGGSVSSFFGSIGQGIASPFVAIGSGLSSLGSDIGKIGETIWYGDQMYANDFVTNTDFFNVDQDEKTKRIKAWNEQTANTKSLYDNLSSKQKAAIKGLGFSHIGEDFVNADEVEYDKYGKIKISSMNFDVLEDGYSSKDIENMIKLKNLGITSSKEITQLLYEGEKFGLSDDSYEDMVKWIRNPDVDTVKVMKYLNDADTETLQSIYKEKTNIEDQQADLVKKAIVSQKINDNPNNSAWGGLKQWSAENKKGTRFLGDALLVTGAAQTAYTIGLAGTAAAASTTALTVAGSSTALTVAGTAAAGGMAAAGLSAAATGVGIGVGVALLIGAALLYASSMGNEDAEFLQKMKEKVDNGETLTEAETKKVNRLLDEHNKATAKNILNTFESGKGITDENGNYLKTSKNRETQQGLNLINNNVVDEVTGLSAKDILENTATAKKYFAEHTNQTAEDAVQRMTLKYSTVSKNVLSAMTETNIAEEVVENPLLGRIDKSVLGIYNLMLRDAGKDEDWANENLYGENSIYHDPGNTAIVN